MDITRRNFVIGGIATAATGALARLDSTQTATQETQRVKELAKIQGRFLPNVKVTTHEGKVVNFYDDLVKDKIVLINFFYATCKRTCPIAARNLMKVQDLLGSRVGKDVFFISISLKPKVDTPAILANYAKKQGNRPGWTFLTGKPEDIELLRRKMGFTDPDPEEDKDNTNHMGILRYGNAKIGRWAACPILNEPEEIEKAVKWLSIHKSSVPNELASHDDAVR